MMSHPGDRGVSLTFSPGLPARPAKGFQGFDNPPQEHDDTKDKDPVVNTDIEFGEVIDEGTPALGEAGRDEDQGGCHIGDGVFEKGVQPLHRYVPSPREGGWADNHVREIARVLQAFRAGHFDGGALTPPHQNRL